MSGFASNFGSGFQLGMKVNEYKDQKKQKELDNAHRDEEFGLRKSSDERSQKEHDRRMKDMDNVDLTDSIFRNFATGNMNGLNESARKLFGNDKLNIVQDNETGNFGVFDGDSPVMKDLDRNGLMTQFIQNVDPKVAQEYIKRQQERSEKVKNRDADMQWATDNFGKEGAAKMSGAYIPPERNPYEQKHEAMRGLGLNDDDIRASYAGAGQTAKVDTRALGNAIERYAAPFTDIQGRFNQEAYAKALQAGDQSAVMLQQAMSQQDRLAGIGLPQSKLGTTEPPKDVIPSSLSEALNPTTKTAISAIRSGGATTYTPEAKKNQNLNKPHSWNNRPTTRSQEDLDRDEYNRTIYGGR